MKQSTKSGGQVSTLKKKLGTITVGFLTIEVLNHAFDWVAYPLAIGFLGAVKGGILMTVVATLMNYGLVIIYNKTKQDWFGFEWLRLKREEHANTLEGKVLRTALRIGHWPAFAFLSWEDPFKAFVFIRGRKEPGQKFDRTDWLVFLGSNLLGNLIWILMVSGALKVVVALFQRLV
jgi:hypothetical protein